MNSEHHHGRVVLIALAALAAATFAMSALAADPPVTVTVPTANITAAAPGGSVTAKASVKINDGSTLQSISWKQTGGPTVSGITGDQTDTIRFTLADRKTFREQMVGGLKAMPMTASQFPAHVPVPESYSAGLQDRFGVVGIYPQAMTNASTLKFDITVVTSS